MALIWISDCWRGQALLSCTSLFENTAYFLCIYLRYRYNICKCTRTVCVPMWWHVCGDARLLCLRQGLCVHCCACSCPVCELLGFPVSAFHLAWRADSHYCTSFTWVLGISNSNPQTYMASTWPVNSLPSPCLFILISLQYFSLVSRNCTQCNQNMIDTPDE